MKFTKTFALAALVAGSLSAGPALQAQDTNTPPPGGSVVHNRPNGDQLAKQLGLTDDQRAKVKALLEDQQAKMKALRDDTSLSTTDKRAKAKEIREATLAKMKEILTPDQLAKLQQHLQHKRPLGGAAGAGGSAAPPQ